MHARPPARPPARAPLLPCRASRTPRVAQPRCMILIDVAVRHPRPLQPRWQSPQLLRPPNRRNNSLARSTHARPPIQCRRRLLSVAERIDHEHGGARTIDEHYIPPTEAQPRAPSPPPPPSRAFNGSLRQQRGETRELLKGGGVDGGTARWGRARPGLERPATWGTACFGLAPLSELACTVRVLHP